MAKMRLPTQEEQERYKQTRSTRINGVMPLDPRSEAQREGKAPVGFKPFGDRLIAPPKPAIGERAGLSAPVRWATNAAAGFNNFIVSIPDTVLDATVIPVMEKLKGLPSGTLTRNNFQRLVSATEFEEAKHLFGPLFFGQGEYIGAQDGVGKTFEKAGEFAAGGMTFGLGMTAAAAKTAHGAHVLASPVTNALGASKSTGRAVLDDMLLPFAANPAKAVANETILGAASGAGMGAELAMTDGKGIGGTGGIVGATVGPFSGTIAAHTPVGMVVRGTVSGSKKLVNNFRANTTLAENMKAGKPVDINSSPITKKSAAEAAGIMKETLDNPVVQERFELSKKAETEFVAALKGEKMSDGNDPFFSLAELTGDKPWLKVQQAQEASAEASWARKNIERKHLGIKGGMMFADNKITGDAVGLVGPQYVIDTATGQVQQMVSHLDAEEGVLVSRLAAMMDKFPKNFDQGNRIVAGKDVRDQLRNAMETQKKRADDLAKELGIDTNDDIMTEEVFTTFQQQYEDILRLSDESISEAGLNTMIKRFRDHKGGVKFQDWKRYRDQINQEMNKVVAQQGSRSKVVRDLSMLRDHWDKVGAEYGQIHANFKTFQDFYRTNVIIPFEKTGIHKVMAETNLSTKDNVRYVTQDEKVLDAFLDTPETAQDFITTFGDDANMRDQMRAVVLDDVLKNSKAPDGLNPDKLQDYLNTKSETLKTLGLYDELDNTNRLVTGLSKRAESLKKRKEFIDQNILRQAIARHDKTGNHDQLMNEIVSKPELILEMRRTVMNAARNNPDVDMAKEWHSMIMHRLMDKAPKVDTAPDEFVAYFKKDQTQKVLRAALGEEEAKRQTEYLELYAAGMRALKATPESGGAGVGKLKDVIEELTGSTSRSWSRGFNELNTGRGSWPTTITFFATRALSSAKNNNMKEMLLEANFNPELRNALIKELDPSGVPTTQAQRTVNWWMFNAGMGFWNSGAPPATITEEDEGVAPRSPPVPPAVNTLPPAEGVLKPPGAGPTMGPAANVAPPASPMAMMAAGPTPGPTAPPVGSPGVGDLFPFDTTSKLIQQRRGGGIMGLA